MNPILNRGESATEPPCGSFVPAEGVVEAVVRRGPFDDHGLEDGLRQVSGDVPLANSDCVKDERVHPAEGPPGELLLHPPAEECEPQSDQRIGDPSSPGHHMDAELDRSGVEPLPRLVGPWPSRRRWTRPPSPGIGRSGSGLVSEEPVRRIRRAGRVWRVRYRHVTSAIPGRRRYSEATRCDAFNPTL